MQHILLVSLPLPKYAQTAVLNDLACFNEVHGKTVTLNMLGPHSEKQPTLHWNGGRGSLAWELLGMT